jgi:hypothetical protein
MISIKRILLSTIALLITSFFCQFSPAQTPASEASFKDLRFVEGKWTGTFRGDRQYEAHWSSPSGNTIMGMLRFIRDDRTILFELLTVENTERGMILSVKHFEPGLIGRQERQDAVRYRLVETGKKRAVFEHEVDGSRIAWEGGFNLVRRGTLDNGQWVWTDLFVGKKTR